LIVIDQRHASGYDRQTPREYVRWTLHTVTLVAETQMKFARTCIAVAAIIAPGSFSGQATSQPRQSEIDSADRLFQAGKFAEAGKLYSQIAAQNPKDYSAILRLGCIACQPA
jgi:hypothetical protein